jgi:hypothetical protein
MKRRRLSKADLVAFKARWRLVNETEVAELRRTPLEVKLRQLEALMASVDALGWREVLASEEAVVRERWQRLRRAYGV